MVVAAGAKKDRLVETSKRADGGRFSPSLAAVEMGCERVRVAMVVGKLSAR
jgi:hypothetical protein